MAVAKIDHTPMDVIVVDEEHRQPIQRPSLTVVIDWGHFVLVVYTESYRRRFLGREEPDKGKGADWEGSLNKPSK